VGRMLFYAREYDQAIQQLHATITLDPDFPAAHYYLGSVYEALGMYEKAYAEFFNVHIRREITPPGVLAIQKIHAKSGWKGAWQKSIEMMLHERATGKFVSAYDIAQYYLDLGEEERALDWLVKAVAEHSNWVIYLNVDPRFNRFHSSPRFQDLVLHIGSTPK